MKMQAYVLEFKYGLTLDTLREKRVIGKMEDGDPFSEYIKKDFLLTNNIEGLYTLNYFDSEGGAQWFTVGILMYSVLRNIEVFDSYGSHGFVEKGSWYFFLSERYGDYWINRLRKDHVGNCIASCHINEIRNEKFVRMDIGILKPIII